MLTADVNSSHMGEMIRDISMTSVIATSKYNPWESIVGHFHLYT